MIDLRKGTDPNQLELLLENRRHDYLVRDLAGNQIVVYQFELKEIAK